MNPLNIPRKHNVLWFSLKCDIDSLALFQYYKNDKKVVSYPWKQIHTIFGKLLSTLVFFARKECIFSFNIYIRKDFVRFSLVKDVTIKY